jgi:hypothetical protein
MIKALSIAGIGLALLMMLCASAGTASAATPTPTLRPILASPTSAYLYLRPTPTPFTITTSPFTGAFLVDGGPIADNAINIWNFANRDHVIDFVLIGLIMISLIGLVIKLIGRFDQEARNQG